MNYEKENLKIYSLGGCVVDSVGAMSSGKHFIHADHLWRRPTISLMSKPVQRFSYKFSNVPEEFSNYLINDLSKSHLKELSQFEEGSIILTDVTRDLFTGVLEIENDVYIMDPMDGRGIIGSLSDENMSYDILRGIFSDRINQISAFTKPDTFFPIWEDSIRKFAEFCLNKRFNVFLAEIYFTSKMDFEGDILSPDPIHAEFCNNLLEKMYNFIRNFENIHLFSVNRDDLVTGVDVKWGGPTFTHFVSETYAMFEINFKRSMREFGIYDANDVEDFESLRATAFERAKSYAATRAELLKVQGELNITKKSLCTAEARLMQGAFADLNISRTRINQLESQVRDLERGVLEREASSQSLTNEIAHRDAEIENLRAAYAEAQALLAAANVEVQMLQDAICTRDVQLASMEESRANSQLVLNEMQALNEAIHVRDMQLSTLEEAHAEARSLLAATAVEAQMLAEAIELRDMQLANLENLQIIAK